MRNLNVAILSDVNTSSKNGAAIDTNQTVSASFHFLIGDATAAGTVKIQGSNDPSYPGGMSGTTQPSNWSDIPSASVTYIAGASNPLILIPVMSFRWIRAVSTITTPGSTTIVCNMNSLSV